MATNIRQRGSLRNAAAAAAGIGSGPSAVVVNRTASKAVFHLDVTAVTGTLPTLNVDIEWRDPASGKWLVLFSFAELTAAGNETIWLGDPADANFLPGEIRASWVVGGTATPTVTFTLGFDLINS